MLLLLVSSLGAQTKDEERRGTAMVSTVLGQLEAFRRGDWAAAYGYASAAIRDRFPPEAFRRMVTEGYAAIADSVGASVRSAIVLDGHGVVEIRVFGRNGQTLDALYELVEEQGTWRIGGVVAKPVEPGNLTQRGTEPAARASSRDAAAARRGARELQGQAT